MIQATEERVLLAWVTARQEAEFRELHRLTRRQAILREAATQLRTGKDAGIVRAMLRADGVDG